MFFDRRFRVSAMGGLVLFVSAIAGAQETAPIDQQAIEQAVRDAEAEASAFAAEVAARAEAYTEDARALADGLGDRIRSVDIGERSDGDIDFSNLLAGAASIADVKDTPPPSIGVMLFVSFSMPEPSLKELVVDARAAGVPVVLQGFVDGSLEQTARRMADLIGHTGGPDAQAEVLGGVVIDPRAFRVFDVHHVPTFISTAHPLPDCDGLDCSAPPPPHDRIAGNMSLAAALEALAREGTFAPSQANAARARLEGRS